MVCIIRDLIDVQANAVKHSLTLPASMSVRVLLAEVCKQFGYMLNTISLHYEKQDGTDTHEVWANFHPYFLSCHYLAKSKEDDILFSTQFLEDLDPGDVVDDKEEKDNKSDWHDVSQSCNVLFVLKPAYCSPA